MHLRAGERLGNLENENKKPNQHLNYPDGHLFCPPTPRPPSCLMTRGIISQILAMLSKNVFFMALDHMENRAPYFMVMLCSPSKI